MELTESVQALVDAMSQLEAARREIDELKSAEFRRHAVDAVVAAEQERDEARREIKRLREIVEGLSDFTCGEFHIAHFDKGWVVYRHGFAVFHDGTEVMYQATATEAIKATETIKAAEAAGGK